MAMLNHRMVINMLFACCYGPYGLNTSDSKNKTPALHVAAPVQLCPGTRELMQIRMGNKGHHEFNEYLILTKFDE